MYKKSILTLGLIATAITPIFVASCGSAKKFRLSLNIDTPQGPVVAIPDEIKNATIDYFDDSKLDKTPYSLDTLHEEAKSINYDSVWTGGIGPNGLQSTISLVRALATSYGYEEKDISGKSQKDLFLQNQNYTFIDDDIAKQILTNPANQTDVARFLASLHYDKGLAKPLDGYKSVNSAIAEKNFGDQGFDPLYIKRLWIKPDNRVISYEYVDYSVRESHGGNYGWFIDVNKDNKIDTMSDVDSLNNHFDPWSVWDDAQVPNQRDALLIYKDEDKNEKYYREIKMPDFNNTSYPIIDNTKFEQEYIPYVQSALVGLLKCLTNPMVQNLLGGLGGHINIDLLIDQVAFLVSKNYVPNTQTVDFNNFNFIQHLKNLNIGTQDFLAVKAFYKGFDNSFTTGKAAPFAIIAPGSSGWDWHSSLKGMGTIIDEVKAIQGDDADIFAVQTWLQILQGNSQFHPDVTSLFGFRPNKTIDELYTSLAIPDSIRDKNLAAEPPKN